METNESAEAGIRADVAGVRADVAGVRAFTRAWTAAAALLGESYLDSPLSVAEARIVYELAGTGPCALVDLRRR
ncbi:MAG: hypothetical protein ACQSGP_13720, partial [Frankia sp.]